METVTIHKILNGEVNTHGDCKRLRSSIFAEMRKLSREGNAIEENLQGYYDDIATQKVNNPKSSFYIYGQ